MVWINISKNIKNIYIYIYLKNPIEDLWDEIGQKTSENVSKIEERLMEEIRRSYGKIFLFEILIKLIEKNVAIN